MHKTRPKQTGVSEGDALDQALGNLQEPAFLKDRDGRIVWVNSAFSGVMRKPVTELVGKTDLDLNPPDLAAKYRADDLEVMRSEKAVALTEVNESPDGPRTVQVVKIPFRDSRGDVTGVLGIFWDVTESE